MANHQGETGVGCTVCCALGGASSASPDRTALFHGPAGQILSLLFTILKKLAQGCWLASQNQLA